MWSLIKFVHSETVSAVLMQETMSQTNRTNSLVGPNWSVYEKLGKRNISGWVDGGLRSEIAPCYKTQICTSADWYQLFDLQDFFLVNVYFPAIKCKKRKKNILGSQITKDFEKCVEELANDMRNREKKPYVIIGDFNLTPPNILSSNYEVRAVRKSRRESLEKFKREFDFCSCRDYFQKSHLPTYVSKQKQYIHKSITYSLDNCLVSNEYLYDIKSDYDVLQFHLGSDHCAIIFSFPCPENCLLPDQNLKAFHKLSKKKIKKISKWNDPTKKKSQRSVKNLFQRVWDKDINTEAKKFLSLYSDIVWTEGGGSFQIPVGRKLKKTHKEIRKSRVRVDKKWKDLLQGKISWKNF